MFSYFCLVSRSALLCSTEATSETICCVRTSMSPAHLLLGVCGAKRANLDTSASKRSSSSSSSELFDLRTACKQPVTDPRGASMSTPLAYSKVWPGASSGVAPTIPGEFRRQRDPLTLLALERVLTTQNLDRALLVYINQRHKSSHTVSFSTLIHCMQSSHRSVRPFLLWLVMVTRYVKR